MGMSSESSHVPTIDQLRAAALVHGVEPSDADLEAVRGFLATVLPALEAVESAQEQGFPPAGLFLPDPEAS
jgi:hypothetical protein